MLLVSEPVLIVCCGVMQPQHDYMDQHRKLHGERFDRAERL